MKLYVYRINDHEYGVGLGREGCEALGVIVEQWQLNSPADARFLASHGTSYHGASDKVSRIADLVHDLMVLDPTYRPTEPTPEPIITLEPKRNLFQRIMSWCYAR